ncbi:MAG: penicillin-binding protein 2 [Solirubrobacteraceae bacterium]|nr:MAG: penicillin-binding protein 2 [Solirubrobacterales bacterium]
MIQPPSHFDERRPPITPQLAVRVAILGAFAFALFAIIFFRLWFLQVLSGDQYLAKANENRVREIAIPAPRGVIVDDQGRQLVSNRRAEAIQIDPQNLPPSGPRRQALYRRLGAILALAPQRIAHEVFIKTDPRHGLPYAAVTLTTDAALPVYNYVAEHQAELDNAVQITPVFTRDYPRGDLAAQLFGTVGQISPQELKDTVHYRGVRLGTIVGQDGIERAYDHYLRGQNGAERVQIDALGNPKGTVSTTPPAQGQRLKLSLDLGMERAAQDALGQAVANSTGDAGGAVAIDPRTGAIVAMASYPSFDPNIFSKPLSQSVYDQLSKQQPAPLINRAIGGVYPTGSTMKPITATAALGTPKASFTPGYTVDDAGCVTISKRQFCNAGKAVNGSVDLQNAIRVSSDVYFYTVGALLNPIAGEPLQTWMHKLGLGNPSGIDVAGESNGLVPDRAWRAHINDVQVACARRYGPHSLHCFTAGGAPLFSDGRPWAVGDNVNLAVGQGDLEASPLQMAVAYSALQNGGTVVTPHLGVQIEDNQGAVVQQLDVPPTRHVNLPAGEDVIRAGLHDATSQPGGTSYDVFNNFPVPVYGKTGTAQRPPHNDQSWFLCWVDAGQTPKPHGPLVVAVTIENGGFGAQAAAPAARLILSKWVGTPGQFVVGSSKTL